VLSPHSVCGAAEANGDWYRGRCQIHSWLLCASPGPLYAGGGESPHMYYFGSFTAVKNSCG
jgi:hypothetical protein